MVSSIARLLFVLSAVFLVCTGHYYAQPTKNSAEPQNISTTLTGILLVSDCDEWTGNVPKGQGGCLERSSQWGLITPTKQYSIRGNTSELKDYERRRVTVTGRVSEGTNKFIERLDVESVAPSEMPESEIRDLVEQLRRDGWKEPHNMSNPTSWIFNFTSPMLQIMQAGPPAQGVLLEYLDDTQIKDQVIILLGGVGDAKAVDPIIHAMADRDEARDSACARKVNLAANLALTNITVGDVIWHHGGGISIEACPEDPKSCWYAWWVAHKEAFDISKTVSRNYSNYPSYGIYQAPGLFRSASFH